MKTDIIDNNKIFLERIEFYKKLGLDQLKEREFVLKKTLPLKGNILEVGTGKGHFSLMLAKNGYRFTTIDIDKEGQDIARLTLAYYRLQNFANFKIEDACCLSFPDKSFDFIFCIHVYHHLKDSHRVLKEMIRVLKPAGRIILSDFSKAGMNIINKCHTLEGRKHDCFQNDLSAAQVFFSNRGFAVFREENFVQDLIIASRKEQ
ncbi:MAG: class I SAM-dependent methyltransferase [Candidatus Omnitrophica bacterium]|nr:class I SAM-dependent methyltransferase [Candidatus Omnitrophota bacterium]